MPRFLPAPSVLLAGLLTTLGALRVATGHEQRRAHNLYQARFEDAARHVFVDIEREAAAELGVVLGLASFFAASDHVDQEEFLVYADPAVARHAGLVALEWAPWVPAAALPAFLEQARVEGWPVRALTSPGPGAAPEAPTAGHFPVRYRHPVGGNEPGLGVDLYAEPQRRAAIDAALRSGSLQTTAPLDLVQGGGAGTGFLAVAPVFRGGADTATEAARRAAIEGLALGVFRVDDLARAALHGQAQRRPVSLPLDVLVYEASGPDDRLPVAVESTHGSVQALPYAQARAGISAEHALAAAADAYLVVARPLDQVPPPAGPPLLPWIVGLAGVSLTLAGALVVHGLASRTAEVARQVSQRTAELAAATRSLAESEHELRAIVDNSIDGIMLVDHDGRVRSVNPVVPRIFELPAEHIVGHAVSRLLPEPHRSRVEGELQGVASSVGQGVVGRLSELYARRASGALFPIELAVVELQDAEPSGTLWILRDITERREVDRMKDQFISTVSHELRTPLSSILGSLELVNDGLCGPLPDQAARMVRLAYDNGERLLRLINDILDLERLGSGGMELELEELDAAVLVHDALEANLGFAERHGVVLGRKVRAGELFVRADRHRALQVFANLLANAVRFSPPGGRVRVSATPRHGEVVFSVSDEGEGIPADFHPYVFAPFSQADGSDRRKVGGTGLGLSIAKAIVEEHGGSIWFETRRGAGTTFCFSLPAVGGEPRRA